MTSNRDRQQRAAARARLEHNMALRAEAADRRRRIRMTITGAASFIVVAGLIVVIAVVATGGDDSEATASGSAAPCQYSPLVDPSASESPQPLPSEIQHVGTPPQDMVVRKGVQLMTMETTQGTIRIQLDTAKAPCTAASLTYLAGKGFFDNTKCHRLVTDGIYALQCGDPSATGMGGPDYRMPEENLPTDKTPAYPEGVLAMAKTSDPNTTGSQFFIVYQDTTLQPDYTVVGHVLQGLDVVKKVAAAGVTPADPSNPSDGEPKLEMKITSMTISKPADSLPTLPPVSPVAPGGSAAPAASSLDPSAAK